MPATSTFAGTPSLSHSAMVGLGFSLWDRWPVPAQPTPTSGLVMVLNIIRESVVVASGTQPSDHFECCCSIWSPIPGDPSWGSTHPQITGLTKRAQKPARSHQPQILARVWWQGTGLLQISVTCLTQSEPQNMTQTARICGAWIASWLETWVLCAQLSFYPMKKGISALNLLT